MVTEYLSPVMGEITLLPLLLENLMDKKRCLNKIQAPYNQSGRQDSNLRPPAPKAGILPG